MDKLAQEDHTYRLSKEEFKRDQGQWYLSHIEHIGQECADATSIRLSSCSNKQEPSPSRIRRRTCRTYSFSTISEMAPFFLKRFLMELGHGQKLVELMSSIHFKNVCCSRFRLQLIAIYCNRRGCRQHTSHVIFFCAQCAC